MRAVILAMMIVLGAVAARAADVTECDRLASHPDDPDRVAPGFHDNEIVDKPKAIAACEAAVKADPTNARLHYQLGRVYFYLKQPDKALPHLEFAAKAGHRQTQFVLGYIIDEGMQGLAKDPCRVEDLWVKSARAGRFAALVSYPHHAMTGRFAACKLQASTAEIGKFLETAKPMAPGYYESLLVTTLVGDYAVYAKAH